MGKVGFQGFNNKDFQLSILDSERWKAVSEALRSGFLEIVCYDVPEDKDASTVVDVVRTGITQRNPLKIISARGHEVTFRQLLNNNYMNCFKDVIKTSLGDIVLKTDVNGNFKETNVNGLVVCGIKPSAVIKTGAKPFYFNLLKGGKVIYTATVTPSATLDTKAEIVRELVTALEGLDTTNGWIEVIQCNSSGAAEPVTGEYFSFSVENAGEGRFDSYECSENISVGCLVPVKNSSGIIDSSFVNDKTPYVAILKNNDSSEVLDIVTIVGVPASNVLQLVGNLNSTFVKYATNDLKIQMISWIDFDAKENHIVDYMIRKSAQYLPTEQNEQKAGGASVISAVNAIGSGKIELPLKEQPMIEVMMRADSYEYVKPMDDDFIDATAQWKEATREGSIRMPRATFPYQHGGDTPPEWTITWTADVPATTPTTTKDDYFGVYINGEEFKVKVATPGTTTISAVVTLLKTLIDSDARYTATNVNNVLSIEAVDVSNDLHCEGFVLETTAVTTATPVNSLYTQEPESKEYDEESKFVSFDKFLIGDAYCNMYDFCEVSKATFDIQRTITDIASVCGEQGRKGLDNSEYTIYLTLDVTDIQAVKVHDKWDKFINNKDFMLFAADTKSGVTFFFPKCRIEEHVNAAQETLQGHQYKVNVNYDPNRKFAFALQQILLQTTP